MQNEVYGYIRVSTIRQGLKGVSLQEQKSAIEKYAKNHDLIITNWFEERETAAKQGRPVFSKMLTLLRQKKASGVIIHKIDRSARNLRDWASLGELIDEGIEIYFAHESVDLSARGGRLSADIQAVVATDYIRNLREEALKGLYGRLKQGYFPFYAPLGYLNNGSGKAKTPDPFSSPLIKEAFQIYSSGECSLRKLRKHLSDKGLRGRNGGEVSLTTLSGVLRNPFYMGIIYIKSKKRTYKGNHEPIISKELFDHVQDVLDGKVKKGPGKYQFLFRRLFKCKTCSYSTIGEKQKGHVYYRCHSSECRGTCVREEEINKALENTFSDLKFDESEEQIIDEVLEELQGEHNVFQKMELKRLSLQEAKLSERLNSLTDKYVDGDLERDVYLRRKKSCMADLKEVEENIRNWQEHKQATFQKRLKNLELTKSLYSSFFQADDQHKRQLVKMCTSNRLINVKSVLLELKTPFRELAMVFDVPHGGASRVATRRMGKLSKKQNVPSSGASRDATRRMGKLPNSENPHPGSPSDGTTLRKGKLQRQKDKNQLRKNRKQMIKRIVLKQGDSH